MRFPIRAEQSFFSYRFLSGLRLRLRLLIAVAVVTIGLSTHAASARADPIPESELAAMFVWVTDDESAEFAYQMASMTANEQTRQAMLEFLLLTVWANGGNPWKLNPNWVAPTGP